MTNALAIRTLVKDYGGKRAVDNLTHTIEAGWRHEIADLQTGLRRTRSQEAEPRQHRNPQPQERALPTVSMRYASKVHSIRIKYDSLISA